MDPHDEAPSYLDCPICFLVMSAPGRIPMVTSCGHTFCYECLSQLQNQKCPICNKPMGNAVKNFALSDIIETYLQTHTVPPDRNPPSTPPPAITNPPQAPPQVPPQRPPQINPPRIPPVLPSPWYHPNPANSSDICTHSLHGDKYIAQKWYECHVKHVLKNVMKDIILNLEELIHVVFVIVEQVKVDFLVNVCYQIKNVHMQHMEENILHKDGMHVIHVD